MGAEMVEDLPPEFYDWQLTPLYSESSESIENNSHAVEIENVSLMNNNMKQLNNIRENEVI